MNDQSSRLPPEQPEDDPDDERRELAASLQRKIMERNRRAAALDHVKPQTRWLQHAMALVAALVVVLLVTLGFDAFLSSMQRVMHMMDQQEEQQKAREPMPAYVVPTPGQAQPEGAQAAPAEPAGEQGKTASPEGTSD
jgi:hypothetical protein